MQTKASIKNHPLHPMLVSIPIGLWVFSLVADILFLRGMGGEWRIVSGYCIAGGILGALAAAVPGLIDYTTLNGKPKEIGTWHMILNLCAVASYAINFFIRYNNGFQVEGLPLTLSIVTIIFLSISGWLGGELVYVHRVAVKE